MLIVEVETRRIIARPERDGWINRGGSKQDASVHPDRPDVLIVVPCHREQSSGVARDIAKRAGWR